MNPPPGELIDDLRLLGAPGPWWTQWWAIAIVAVLLGFATFRFLRWRRRRLAAVSGVEVAAPDTAHEDALAELERLFALVEAERSRPYAIESSAIVRRYIERRFQIRAPLRSTEEFLHEAQHSPRLTAEHQSLLGEFLGCCDFLKFARGLADRVELEKLHRSAVDFVKATRPQAVVQPEAAAT